MRRFATCIALLALVSPSLTGCQTYGESAATGGLLGSALGAIIGHQSGHQGEGAIIGAVLGGMTGLVVHDVQAQQTRGGAETAEEYGYEARQGEVLELEYARVLPSVVARGNMVEATVQYALVTHEHAADVKETRVLRRDGKVVAELSTKHFTRASGSWVTTLPFRVPRDLAPGEYELVQTVRTAESSISSVNTFHVSAEI
jgi:hypothetical protein